MTPRRPGHYSEEFDHTEIPLVAGSIFGQRQFFIKMNGQLRAVSEKSYVWTAGENIAGCRHHPRGTAFWGWRATKEGEFVRARIPHQVAGANCSCGFYAFFRGINKSTFYSVPQGPWMMNGIIEGYGRCTVGTRGFRAEKAKIVALAHQRLHPVEAICGAMLWIMIGGWFATSGYTVWKDMSDGNWVSLIFGILSLLVSLVGIAMIGMATWPFILKMVVKRRYPDVPFFKSMSEARKAFPPTKASDYS